MVPITVSVSDASAEVKYSRWVRFDSWALPNILISCVKTGTVDYTIQTTSDDPNSPSNPVAVNDVTWFNSNDTTVVGATANAQSNFIFIPTFARVKLNSGSGTVKVTFTQAGVVPQ